MTSPEPDTKLRVADLPQNRPTSFELRPDKARMKSIADELGLMDLRKLSFRGSLQAQGRTDWRLEAELGATVVQPCVVTLEPVTTRIDEAVTRLFAAEMPGIDADADEMEMPDDDTLEPLGEVIDLDHVMREALSLALPLYPRREDAEHGTSVFTEPGKAPLRDEDTKPFAGLAEMKKRLENGD